MQKYLTGSATLALLVLCGLSGKSAAQNDPVYIDAVSSSAERNDVSAWLKETRELMASKEFRDNLTEMGSDYTSISFGSKSGTAADILNVLELKGTPYKYFRTPITLVGNQHNATALTGHNGEKVNGILVNSMALGRQHFVRYRSTNVVERSCAINTLAHEMTHIVTDHAQWAQAVFEDTGAGSPIGGAKPIASYLVGSVAQCTYLQNAGRIKKDELRTCVAVFGDSEFNNGRCNQFAAADIVQWPKKPPRP